MPRFEYQWVDVFTSERFGGNALAVFPKAEGIGDDDMRRIARELNLSETTFVVPSPDPVCEYRVRIFTPSGEIPMAGHPTVGTAFVLDHGDRVTFLEGVGPILVERVVLGGARMWRMTQPVPTWGEAIEDRAGVAAALGLDAADLEADLPVQFMSSGLPFVFVPLRTVETLGRIRVRSDCWEPLAARLGAGGLFCFAAVPGAPETVRARMFAPTFGVPEDPATGSACGPLGCYLVRYGLVAAGGPARVLVRQGVEMGRPSELHVEVDGGAQQITGVRVAGECVAVGGGYVVL